MSAQIQLVFADKNGRIYPYPGLEGVGMKAGHYSRLDPRHLVPLPEHAEFFLLPDRVAVGYDAQTNEFVELPYNPYSQTEEPCTPVAAFLPPGLTLTHSTAYAEKEGAGLLPLFAYAPCVFYKNEFYASAVPVDTDIRHDERFMDPAAIQKNIDKCQKLFPKNRLVPHLANCATVNACANAKNFFLGRFEAPIPVSPVCNAQCQGCISYQPPGRVPPTQKRITFTPTPEEIAQIALYHMEREPDPLVSFGQGCEGEPTLAGDTIEKAIRLIRRSSSKGSINLNTNAGRPDSITRLFDAGLNTVRVSTNAVREPYYSLYYQPKGYSFKEVTASVDAARRAGGFVSLNYLSMPGFTDSREEFDALKTFIGEHGVNMIQWRNLNYDPRRYFRDLGLDGARLEMLGMPEILAALKEEYPKLDMGYFNPKKTLVRESIE
ncbi:MAG: radical SAM protein [Candidatus Omnitrophota bacterium]